MNTWSHYLLPTTIFEALQAYHAQQGHASLVAGGSDLLLDIQQGRHPAGQTLIDLSLVPELGVLEERPEGIYIGAAVPLSQLVECLPRAGANAALREACELIGGPQVRNAATLGGNVAHALPAGDGTIALLALGAQAWVAGLLDAQVTTRQSRLEDLFLGPGKSALTASGEILLGFQLPPANPGQASAFRRVMRPQGVAIAILNMAVWLARSDERITALRVALGPAGPVPFRARATEAFLTGKSPDTTILAAAVEVLLNEARFRTSPHRATADYRRQQAATLLTQVLESAWARAGEHLDRTFTPVRVRPLQPVELTLPIPPDTAQAPLLHFTVNGQALELASQPGEMLSDLLRERLGLTGTKVGCNEAECGACTVLMDGQPILACTTPAPRAAGKAIWTIEGLASLAPRTYSPAGTSLAPGEHQAADQPGLNPLQAAFILHGAVQCGFCIPGQLMTAWALVQRSLQESGRPPSAVEIKAALKDTLCRCAGYPTIISAIQAGAAALQSGGSLAIPQVGALNAEAQAVGSLQPRPDAVEKVTGTALFTDDLHFPGMLQARVLRAGAPHAFLRSLDVSQARALPGVAAVLTAVDLPGELNHGLVVYDWPVMVGIGERVRTVGDALAIVAAETREIASQALTLMHFELEMQPVVSDPVQARQADAPQLHSGGNLLKHIKIRKGDMQAGFAAAEIILEDTFHTAITDHAFLETECSIARPLPDGRMEIYVGSQIPYSDRSQVARALGWPDEQVRVIGQLVGGGFGGKEDIAGQIHAALLAQATGRPVKLLWDRHESLLVHPKRHATQIRVRLGARRDGTLTAVETELYGDTGAYASLGEKVMTRATTHSAGPYEAPHVRADCYAMYTNNPPAGAFRGFGVTQSAFAVETMMDCLAEQLGLDPLEVRRRNALRLGSVTNTGQELKESVGLLECMDRVEAEMRRVTGEQVDGGSLFQSRQVPGAPYLRRAWGFAAGYKNTGLGGGAPDKAGAEVELYPDGTLEVRTASAELGQGLVTVLRLIVAQEFNLPPGQVRVLVMDTDLTPDGGPTTASRQTYVTGNAARYAAQALREALSAWLAEKVDCPPEAIRYVEGLAQVDGQIYPLGQVAQEMKSDGRPPRALYEYWAPKTQPLGQGGDMHFAYSFAAQAAEVEVDTRSGEVRVLRVIAANDVGKAINPLGLQGQVEGGVMMGLGNALTENFIVEQGRVITDRLARYRVPSIAQTPEITSIIVEHPTAAGPYGAKGVGEIVSIPTTPAITNAIYNAVGVRIRRTPVDQEEILKAMNDQQSL